MASSERCYGCSMMLCTGRFLTLCSLQDHDRDQEKSHTEDEQHCQLKVESQRHESQVATAGSNQQRQAKQ